jgi:O-antigen/teichoic acid export membrane protein
MAGAVNAAYLVFVSALFYDRVGVRLVPVGTLTGAGCSVLFTLLLIPRLGLLGGAIAALLAQSAAAVLIALLARRYEPIRWPYLRVLAGFLLILPATLVLAALDLSHPLLTVAAKLAGIGVAGVMVGLVFWNSPLAFFRVLRRLIETGRAWLARRTA